tara:strand:+ start:4755 stop:4931 length:177 start_codon:yes stop_codon:yes gene_type:complete
MEKEKRIRELESYKTLRILRNIDTKITKLDLTEDEREIIEEMFDMMYEHEKLKLYGLE